MCDKKRIVRGESFIRIFLVKSKTKKKIAFRKLKVKKQKS